MTSVATGKKRRTGAAGFTLAEMLVALVAAGVLLLVVGTLLWFGFLGLTRTRQSVELQRDMRASMATLAQMTHSATSLSFSTNGFFAYYSTQSTRRVYSLGTNLFFDPDTTVAGSDQILADGTLLTFNITLATNLANVVLALGNAEETVSNRVVFFRRN